LVECKTWASRLPRWFGPYTARTRAVEPQVQFQNSTSEFWSICAIIALCVCHGRRP
jgi:hypothetical protein